MKKHNFDAVIFDLDGVITDTAATHSIAWKQMFDEFLRTQPAPFREFTHENDYLPYVDGKPRHKGVASFLESREIELPFGAPSDTPDKITICGLGNRKNELFNKRIQAGDVRVYQGTVDLMHALKDTGIRIGVASSSKNAKVVLETVNLLDMIETRVDGVVSAELGLKGKPQADIFTTACNNLGIVYDRAVIVEDAISGVQAGRNGGFGLVLGVAREDNAHALKINGADIVIEDLAEISIEKINQWFSIGLQDEMWSIRYDDYAPDLEGTRESLLTVGNGFFGTRGALEESFAGDVNYPGTYIAGLYNRLESEVSGRTVSNEDFVNVPNWLPITFKIGDGEWFSPPPSALSGISPRGGENLPLPPLGEGWDGGILSVSRDLNFRTGVLRREIIVEDPAGNQTKIISQRFASMDNPHLATLRYEITPLNYDGEISIRSMLDGDIINANVARYSDLSSKHLEGVKAEGEGNRSSLLVKTNESDVLIAEAARLDVALGGREITPAFEQNHAPAKATSTFAVDVKEGVPLTVDKLVAIYASNQNQVENVGEAAQNALSQIKSFDEIRQASASAWKSIWEKVDIQITGDRVSQKLLRLHLYHSFVTSSPHNAGLDAGIPARGLHGEAYRGHIFWDEFYILPFLNLHLPESARSILMYRYRRLDAARKLAQEYKAQGAIFPWQSGSSGREETQTLHLNPLSGKWGEDYSILQRHVSLAVAYNIWDYLWVNEDQEFLENYGAEIFLEICRFWAGKATLNENGRYDIAGVMGPDEFHEKYPDTNAGGLKNNSYTNILVAWSLRRAFDLLAKIDGAAKIALLKKLQLGDDELARWQDISKKLTVSINAKGVLEQFEGYFDLKELDWAHYREKYANIHRMDRILKAEGKSPDDYKVAKQADALMIFYVLGEKTVKGILDDLGYASPDDLLRRNFDYYLPRTSHGSTLSRLVHAYLAGLLGEEELCWQLYSQALESDYVDIQGGTTKEGIHAGVMTGTVFFALRAFAGIDFSGDTLSASPNLPAHWRKMRFNLGFKGKRHHFVVGIEDVEVS